MKIDTISTGTKDIDTDIIITWKPDGDSIKEVIFYE